MKFQCSEVESCFCSVKSTLSLTLTGFGFCFALHKISLAFVFLCFCFCIGQPLVVLRKITLVYVLYILLSSDPTFLCYFLIIKLETAEILDLITIIFF